MSLTGRSATAAAAAALLLAAFAAVSADGARRRQPIQVMELGIWDAPQLGYAEDQRVVRFVVFGPEKRRIALTLDYGVDRDDDLLIERNEFQRATLHSAPTSEGSRGRLFFRAAPAGREHYVVWRAADDIPRHRITFEQPLRADDGGWLLADAPPGAPLTQGPGVGAALRLRAKKRVVTLTPPFELDTGHAAELALVHDVGTTISFDVSHADSEDKNGDGVFDPAAGEDVNGNSLFDIEHVQVRFWYAPLPEGVFTFGELTPQHIAALDWSVCTHHATSGDADRGLVASPVTKRYSFVWDVAADSPQPSRPYVIGAVAVDDAGRASAFVLLPDLVAVGP